MHDVGHVRAAARRRRRDAVACRARVAHVSAQRVRHGEFEQARLLRGENVLDPSPHARGTLVGARAHQPLDGDDAAAVDDDAHGCERHERERDEDEQELGSEVHGSQPARRIPTGGKYNVKRLDCGIKD